MMEGGDMRDETLCLQNVRRSNEPFESLVVPVHRASTIVFPTVEAYQKRRAGIYDGYSYGLYGTPTSRALEVQLAKLEGASRSLVVQSGFAAIVVVTLACARTGQKVLFPDSAYETVRPFAATFLAGLGIQADYYDPMIGAGIAGLLSDDVALVWVESPGSVTMEVQDVAAIARAARAKGVRVAADNTWATPLRFKPLHHGVDYSVSAASKYLSGHSDVVMGCISVVDESLYRQLKDFSRFLGYGVSADECSLVLRGLETLAVRLDRSEASALVLARWLEGQAFVKEVRYPALPGSPGHAEWKRDFSGATGLFSVFLHDWTRAGLSAAVEALELFAIGASWGGAHSVVAVMDQPPTRTAATLDHLGPVLRFSIGLEHVDDLQSDIAKAMTDLSCLNPSSLQAPSNEASR
jgi:cystathionine beta-lyase